MHSVVLCCVVWCGLQSGFLRKEWGGEEERAEKGGFLYLSPRLSYLAHDFQENSHSSKLFRFSCTSTTPERKGEGARE